MPFKFNAARRHRIPKARYRVRNWPDYGLKAPDRTEARLFENVLQVSGDMKC